jgi:predicted nuclease with TOPRIM domain
MGKKSRSITAWFQRTVLRLFSPLRKLNEELALLRNELAELQQENLRLQDRLEEARADRTRLWDEMSKALDGERSSLRMQINVAWQRMGARAPFPDEPSLPEHVERTEEQSPVPRRELPSERIARKTNEFVRGLVAKQG